MSVMSASVTNFPEGKFFKIYSMEIQTKHYPDGENLHLLARIHQNCEGLNMLITPYNTRRLLARFGLPLLNMVCDQLSLGVAFMGMYCTRAVIKFRNMDKSTEEFTDADYVVKMLNDCINFDIGIDLDDEEDTKEKKPLEHAVKSETKEQSVE